MSSYFFSYAIYGKAIMLLLFFSFCRVYDLCMCINSSPFLGIEQLPQFPHLQQLLGLGAAGTVEPGHIVEPPVIHTATSIVPLGWSGVPGEKNAEQLKVDIVGHGLHLCTLAQARVNGNWYAFFFFLPFSAFVMISECQKMGIILLLATIQA